MYVKNRCPRCGHSIPRDECPGEYPGAKSRVTVDDRRVIEVCSVCGEDEGYEMVMNGRYTPVRDWPIADWMDITKQTEQMVQPLLEEMRKKIEQGGS